MMVTFISQCDKKARIKTRRVLDAFANRIGNGTWQTIITEEGLNTVKKMLRQTASKSSAISCHWIRSRSRSQLLWIVGNKNRFDAQGIVPVNYTTHDLKTDDTEMKTKNFYANTKKQLLDQHLFAVGFIAYKLIRKLTPNEDKLAIAAYVAGCLHDIGKIDPAFQDWINSIIDKISNYDDMQEDGQHIDKGKFTFEEHARHNEISLLLYQLFDDAGYLGNKKLKEFVEHAIYWHHAKPIRKQDYETISDVLKKLKRSLGDIKINDFISTLKPTVKSVNNLSQSYLDHADLQIHGLSDKADADEIVADRTLPKYKKYESNESIGDYQKLVKENAKKSILLNCVITADRLVSALSADELSEYILNKNLESLLDQETNLNLSLSIEIENCLHGFESSFPNSKRNQKQAQIAQQLADIEDVAILKGPAGCGKTKISLEWALKSNVKKIIWICPRVQICQGIFSDLISTEYLPNVRIEICTGEYKFIQQSGKKEITEDKDIFSGDIIITTIDQMINAVITHSNITSFVDFMQAHVIFDEYHEYIRLPGFNLLFSELVNCKQLQSPNGKALLVSATPHHFFVENVLAIDKDKIINMESFNESLYQIKFLSFCDNHLDNSNPLFALQPPNSIVISNTATLAQQSFIKNQNKENAILFHARFTAYDKMKIFNKIFDAFKKDGSKMFDVLRSDSIVQASLNITSSQMVTEFTHAEDWLQRMGRLDRFGENKTVNLYITAIPKTLTEDSGKIVGSCAKWLNKQYGFESAKEWYHFLQNKEIDKSVTINQIYQWYDEFYRAKKNGIEQDLLQSLKHGVENISNNVHDPLCIPSKKEITSKEEKIEKNFTAWRCSFRANG